MAPETRQDMFNVRSGEPGIIELFNAHVEEYIDEIDTVMHEQVSDFMHVDVHIIPPKSHRNYYTCITSGMSDLPMSVPEDCESLQFAELLMTLPPNWPMTRESFIESDDNYWPIRWLKQLARYPYQADTWLSVDHSIPNGDPPEPLASNTKMCGMLLGIPLFQEEFFTWEVSDDKVVHFLQVVPVYKKEMEFKIKKGADELWDKFFDKYDNKVAEELANFQRKCVV